jgi:hypothetical protein
MLKCNYLKVMHINHKECLEVLQSLGLPYIMLVRLINSSILSFMISCSANGDVTMEKSEETPNNTGSQKNIIFLSQVLK